MICKPCKNAADVRSKLKNPNDPVAMRDIKALHGSCTGCGCQHRVEPKTVINESAR